MELMGKIHYGCHSRYCLQQHRILELGIFPQNPTLRKAFPLLPICRRENLTPGNAWAMFESLPLARWLSLRFAAQYVSDEQA